MQREGTTFPVTRSLKSAERLGRYVRLDVDRPMNAVGQIHLPWCGISPLSPNSLPELLGRSAIIVKPCCPGGSLIEVDENRRFNSAGVASRTALYVLRLVTVFFTGVT